MYSKSIWIHSILAERDTQGERMLIQSSIQKRRDLVQY